MFFSSTSHSSLCQTPTYDEQYVKKEEAPQYVNIIKRYKAVCKERRSVAVWKCCCPSINLGEPQRIFWSDPSKIRGFITLSPRTRVTPMIKVLYHTRDTDTETLVLQCHHTDDKGVIPHAGH